MRGLFFRRTVLTAWLIGGLLALSVPIDALQAATKKPVAVYAASVISLGVPRAIKTGEVDQVRVTFKNLGNTTWQRDGKNYVSLYRWNPTTKVEIASAFARPSWETALRPTRLPVPSVGPGQEVSFAFPVKAPDRPGVYREQFILASENVAWIAKSAFDVELNVVVTTASAPSTSAASVPLSSSTPVNPSPSVPAVSSGWHAELVDKGGIEWQVEPGDRATAEISFRNVGSQVWERSTGAFVSLYAVDATGKKERASAFITNAEAKKPVAKLTEERVLPGEIGHFKLTLRGPATPGFYREMFALAAENQAWVESGDVTLPIRVPGRDEFIGTAPPDAPPTLLSDGTNPTSPKPFNDLAAVLIDRTSGRLSGAGYAQKEVYLNFKNVSLVPWKNPSIRFIDIQRPSYANDSSLQDASWVNTNEAVKLLGTTKPGEAVSLAFTFRLPSDQGEYTAFFQLYVDGQPVGQGAVVELPLIVTSNAAVRPSRTPVSSPVTRPTTPVTPITPVPTRPAVDAIPLTGDISSLPAEPLIRVGVLRTIDDRSVIQAMSVPVLVQQSGSTLCRVQPGQQVSVKFDRTSRVYILGEACSGQSSAYYLFRTEDGLSPMRVSDWDRNDNMFRTQLELRYTPSTDSVWLINELSLEWYLKGIAETSNVSPSEFQRTLLTTARTYALYHVQRGTKHADEYYTVDARYDQVYRGYGHEARTPTISAAVDATRGQIVTYQGRLAITPYFSRSDGRTRGWGEVWGGAANYPWLVSVPVPQDIGRTLWGHGVGMSATGALDMANEGKTYMQILAHFYQGTELRRAYR